MREPMTLFEQSNAFNKLNPQRLIIDRTVRHRPVYSSLNDDSNSNVELKSLSFDVYSNKHLITTGKSIVPYSERNRLNEVLLPPVDKDDNPRRHKRKRPSYRKSLFHSYTSNSTQADLAELTARGTKPESQIPIPIIREDTLVSFRRHHAPPPSPSDDEMGRLFHRIQGRNTSRPPSRQSPIENEGYVPFRLPALRRPTRLRRTSTISSTKDVRSTLSNYLQKYY